jgi:Ni,Fe-hydrogenase III small subunit/Pyruvate/2-oxoacid:ferredoxin oxidoreductase delta subunit
MSNTGVEDIIKKFPRVYSLALAGCNGCDIEIIAILSPKFEQERLGIEVVKSPKNAHILMVNGTVNRKLKKHLKNAYDQMADPKLVVAVGSCGISNGPFRECYNMSCRVDEVVPVSIYIPGCPPRPSAILYGLKKTLEKCPLDLAPAPQKTRAKLVRDKKICINCGACTLVCPSKACYFVQDKEKRRVDFNLAYCTFCAQCVEVCPVECLKMVNEYELATSKKEELLI